MVRRSSTNASTSSRKTSVWFAYAVAFAMNFARTRGDTRVAKCAVFGCVAGIAFTNFVALVVIVSQMCHNASSHPEISFEELFHAEYEQRRHKKAPWSCEPRGLTGEPSMSEVSAAATANSPSI